MLATRFFHELTSPQSRSRDACSRRLLDQRYDHLRRPLHILPRQTKLDRQTSCDVGVAISFKSRGALSFAHPTMAHTLARASLLVSRGVSSRETVRISTLKLRQLHQFWLTASGGWLAAFPNDLCWTVERRHPHELTDMLEAGTKFAIVPNALDVAARVGTKSADQHGQFVTPLAHSLAIGP